MLKRFLKRTLIGSIPLMFITAVAFYYYFEVRPNLYGDLGQLGKIPFSEKYETHIRKPRIDTLLYTNYDGSSEIGPIVTIGDSFSQQTVNGFQAYLSKIMGERVTNIPMDPNLFPEYSVKALLDSGFFDRMKGVKVVILESVERSVADRCFDLLRGTPPHTIPSGLWKGVKKKPQDDEKGSGGAYIPEMISKAFKQSRDWALLNLKLHPNPVKKATLAKPLFSHPGKENTLYFYKDDLRTADMGPETVDYVFSVTDGFSKRFAEKGIQFIFMVAPDKYEVYQDFITDGEYRKTGFGKMLSERDTVAYFVNPIDTLRSLAARGEKDLYMANDTHWAYKSASVAAELLARKIRSLSLR